MDENEKKEVWNCDGPVIVPQLSSRAIRASSSPFTKPKSAAKVKSSNEYKEKEGIYDDTGVLYEFIRLGGGGSHGYVRVGT